MRISDWSSDVCSSDLPNVTIGSDIYDMSQKGGPVTNVTVRGQNHPNVADLPLPRVGYARVSTIDQDLDIQVEIGLANVSTQVTNALLVCRLLLVYQHYASPILSFVTLLLTQHL